MVLIAIIHYKKMHHDLPHIWYARAKNENEFTLSSAFESNGIVPKFHLNVYNIDFKSNML